MGNGRTVSLAALAVSLAALAVLLPFAVGLGAETPSRPCPWRELGPFEVPEGEGYDGSRISVSGRVTGIALDAGDPRVVYVGTALGGVWKSDDRGLHWRPTSDFEASLAIGAIAADPRRPGRVVAGTGEANLAFRHQLVRGDRPISGDAGAGVLRSEDGGASWQLVAAQTLGGAAFAELAISRHDPDLILAATTAGLFRSRDGGKSWSRLAEGLPENLPQRMATSVVFDLANPGVAYAAFWASGVFRTETVAAEAPVWTRLTGGLPLSNLSRIALAVSPTPTGELFALVADAESHLRGLYHSLDGGKLWRRLEDAPDLLQGQGFFNLLIAAHPSEPHVFFFGGAGRRSEHASSFYRAALVGESWRFTPLGSQLHIDLHALVFEPGRADSFFVGTDGGIFFTETGGRLWEARNRGLATLQINRIDQHPATADFLLAGSQDNGTLVYRGQPAWDHGDDGDGGFVAIDPRNPDVVYDEFTFYKIARSEQAGRYGSFVPIFPERKGVSSAFYAPFALDPETSTTIALGLDRLFLSHDSGASWAAVSLDLTAGWTARLATHAISALAFVRSDLIYAGTTDGKLWRLDRQPDATWRARELASAEAGLPGSYVRDLQTTPNAPDTVLVAFAGRAVDPVWRAQSAPSGEPGAAGSSWQSASGVAEGALRGREVFALEPDRSNTQIWFAGTDRGVFRSTDGGASWQTFNEALPLSSVFDLQLHRQLPLLRAGTHGRGVWERDLSGASCR